MSIWLVESKHTSVWPLVGANVAQVDDMLGLEPLEKGGEAVCLDLADGDAQCPHPRRGDGQKGICTHGSDSMPSKSLCQGRDK
jgi:hypothetical protein